MRPVVTHFALEEAEAESRRSRSIFRRNEARQAHPRRAEAPVGIDPCTGAALPRTGPERARRQSRRSGARRGEAHRHRLACGPACRRSSARSTDPQDGVEVGGRSIEVPDRVNRSVELKQRTPSRTDVRSNDDHVGPAVTARRKPPAAGVASATGSATRPRRRESARHLVARKEGPDLPRGSIRVFAVREVADAGEELQVQLSKILPDYASCSADPALIESA